MAMARSALQNVLQRARILAAVHTDRAFSDAELLKRFVELNDEAAFTVLVERHSSMVLGVCGRALRHAHDAEDACQATFLVLARKASSIRKTGSLGSWLHGIAVRICANHKRQQARRQKRERRATSEAVPENQGDSWREVQKVLDEEVDKLPPRYRAPLLLCYWEGKTRDEAAEALQLTPGKLHGLLERGRILLRERIVGRGVALSAAMCATFITANVSKAALAPTLVVECTRGAMLVAAGQPVAADLIPEQVLSLSTEVVRTMFVNKLKIVSSFVLCAGLMAALIGGSLSSEGLAQDGPSIQFKLATAQVKGESDEAFIRRISKDLRGTDPTPAEVHFFVSSTDAGKRQKLVDLFIQERQAKKSAAKPDVAKPAPKTAVFQLDSLRFEGLEFVLSGPTNVISLQGKYFKSVAAVKDQAGVAKAAHDYLDALTRYIKDNAKANDVPDAMLQIEMVYRSLGKNVEANAWGEKLRKEHPKSAAAQSRPAVVEGRFIIQLVPEKKAEKKLEKK
jgi:RNA polymerase sigma factor (sigma-70 family)